MSTPNPVLKAAAPILANAIENLQTAINTILTGDPATIGMRAGPAVQILLGQLGLLLPELGVSEIGALNTEVSAKLGALITKLKAL